MPEDESISCDETGQASEGAEDSNESTAPNLKESVDLLKATTGQSVITNQSVASQAYNENFKPAAAELGKTATTISKSINLALLPLESVVWSFEKIRQQLSGLLAKKLENTPVEKIEPPPIHIAGPAIEAMRFSSEQPDLQEMFANLIANSMNIDTRSSTHPAFVEIIKQLSGVEATFLIFVKYMLSDSLAGKRAYELHDEVFQERNPNHTKSFNHSNYSNSLLEARKRAELEILELASPTLISDPSLKNFKIASITKSPSETSSDCAGLLSEIVRKHGTSFMRRPTLLQAPADELWEQIKEENISNLKRLELLDISSSIHSELAFQRYSRQDIVVDTNSEKFLGLTEFGRSFLAVCIS